MYKSMVQKLLLALTALVAWVVGMKKLIEPDMWWYLKTGKWIISNGQVPKEDVFSYSFSGVEWINVKWLYEVIVYGFSVLGGPEFTSIFQSFLGVFIVLTLWWIYKILTSSKSSWAFALVLTPVLLICSYRMTARPETISHWFSLLVLALYFLHRYKNPKWLLAWIPLQLLWTNLHEAYATGLVLMAVLLGSEWILKYFQKTLQVTRIQIIALLGSVLAVAVNPRGFYMLLHPFEIFRQLNENKFTTELYSWNTSYYWNQWQSWAFAILLTLVVVIFLFSKSKKINESIKYGINLFSPGYWVILALFAYLSISAFRNIPFFVLAASPALMVFLRENITQKSKEKVAYISALVLAILAYISIVSNVFYELTNDRNRYGLQVDPAYNPIGLAQALEKIEYHKPHFSDYLSSAYPMWAIEDYQTFIDLRDLDVFPKSFFNEMLLATQNFEAFQEMANLNEFEYAYVKRSDFIDLIGNLNRNTNWRMVYADPVAVLFLKQPDGKHADLFQGFSLLESSSVSNILTRFFNPFYKSTPPDVNLNYMAANFYFSVGDEDLALTRIKQIADHDLRYQSLCLEAQIYDQLAIERNNDSLMMLAWNKLQEATKLDKKESEAHYLMGLMLYERGQASDAVVHFKKSTQLDPQNAHVWSLLADCQNALAQQNPGNLKYQQLWFEYMEKAYKLEPENTLFAYRLGISYCVQNNCQKAAPYLKKLEPLPYLSDKDNAEILQCQRKCGVHVND